MCHEYVTVNREVSIVGYISTPPTFPSGLFLLPSTCIERSLKTESSLLDLLASRKVNECDFPGISALNFVQFASNFCKGKHGVTQENYLLKLKHTQVIHQIQKDLHMICSVKTSY